MIKLLSIYLILLLTSQSELKANEYYIVYTSNINGAIENCGCGPDPLGGLGRIKIAIDQLKRENANVFVIDGGDYFNSYPYPSLNDAMYKALILLNYDCLLPGDQEFVEGKNFYSKYFSRFKNKILLTNGGSLYNRTMEKTIEKIHLNIYGYLSPDIFEFIEKPEYLKLSDIVNTIPKRSTDNDFQIAIIHGYLATAELFSFENTSIDLILLAHDQRRGVWNKNNSIIIGNGKDSEYISIIKIEKGNPWEITVNQKKISEDLPEDDQIIKIIDEYKKKPNKASTE